MSQNTQQTPDLSAVRQRFDAVRLLQESRIAEIERRLAAELDRCAR
jgi:hypothetical protein